MHEDDDDRFMSAGELGIIADALMRTLRATGRQDHVFVLMVAKEHNLKLASNVEAANADQALGHIKEMLDEAVQIRVTEKPVFDA